MRQLQPCIHQNAVPVTGVDEVLQVCIALRVGIVKMPRGDVQRCDAGITPMCREVVRVGACPIGIVEKGPETRTAERRFEAQIRKGLH